MILANIPALGLNQRFKISVKPIAEKKAKIIDGNFMVIIDTPNRLINACCSK